MSCPENEAKREKRQSVPIYVVIKIVANGEANFFVKAYSCTTLVLSSTL